VISCSPSCRLYEPEAGAQSLWAGGGVLGYYYYLVTIEYSIFNLDGFVKKSEIQFLFIVTH
jgi:hypothetical protein